MHFTLPNKTFPDLMKHIPGLFKESRTFKDYLHFQVLSWPWICNFKIQVFSRTFKVQWVLGTIMHNYHTVDYDHKTNYKLQRWISHFSSAFKLRAVNAPLQLKHTLPMKLSFSNHQKSSLLLAPSSALWSQDQLIYDELSAPQHRHQWQPVLHKPSTSIIISSL